MAEDQVVEGNGTTLSPFDDKSKIKVMLSIPSSGQVDIMAVDAYADFFVEIGKLQVGSKFQFFTGNLGRMYISAARENIFSECVKQGIDYCLMMDDDQIVPKDLFMRLWKTMEAKDADLVSPMVTQRLYPFNPVMYRHESLMTEGNKGLINNSFITDYEPNSVVKVDGVGFGVVLLNVKRLAKMNTPRFFSNTHIGEDIWFCIRARQEIDAQMYVDTSIKVGHIRPPEIATEYDYVQAKHLQEKFKTVYPKTREERNKEFHEIAGIGK